MRSKFKRLVALVALVAVVAASGGAYAADQQIDVYENKKLVKSVVFAIGVDQYFVNGQMPGIKMDARAFIENDRTYVPVRYLGYALGLTEKDITWESSVQRVTMRGPVNTIEMAVGSKAIVTMPTNKVLNNTLEIADRKLKIIDVAPLLKAEPAWRTYLPARYVAEGLGYEVAWDEASQTVICWPKGEPRPDVTAVQEYVKQVRAGEAQAVQPPA